MGLALWIFYLLIGVLIDRWTATNDQPRPLVVFLWPAWILLKLLRRKK